MKTMVQLLLPEFSHQVFLGENVPYESLSSTLWFLF